jgi:hypothetical protein
MVQGGLGMAEEVAKEAVHASCDQSPSVMSAQVSHVQQP